MIFKSILSLITAKIDDNADENNNKPQFPPSSNPQITPFFFPQQIQNAPRIIYTKKKDTKTQRSKDSTTCNKGNSNADDDNNNYDKP